VRVDRWVTVDNAAIRRVAADVMVAGSAVFKTGDVPAAVGELRAALAGD
jgi:pentose-5-phosphate-3-epimerase